MSTTVIFDLASTPRVTLTLGDDGAYTAVVEVSDLAPQRSVSSEEQAAGILSLAPPTVRVRAQATEKKTFRLLIDLAQRAVVSAAESTTGESGGPGGLVMSYLRVAKGVRHAIRMLDADAI
jgi:hypothetical protein